MLGPRCLTCVHWDLGRGEEEEKDTEDKRDIGRGVRTRERQRKINKRRGQKN